MQVGRGRGAERELQHPLPRRVVVKVESANDVRDPLGRVVDDDRELVGVEPVTALEHEVAGDGFHGLDERRLHAVLDLDRGEATRAQSHREALRVVRGSAPAAAEIPDLGGLRETVAAARQGGGGLPGRGGGDLGAGAGTEVGEVSRREARQRLLVEFRAGALADDRPVPLESEGVERPKDRIGGAGYLARPVDVLDANEPCAALRARIEVAADRRQERARVQRAGR